MASSYGFVGRPAREGVQGLLLRLVELVGGQDGLGREGRGWVCGWGRC